MRTDRARDEALGNSTLRLMHSRKSCYSCIAAALAGRPTDPRVITVTQDIAAAVIQKQLEAYNAKDLDALLDTYAPDAEQYSLHGPLLARGRDALRARFAERFLEPDLHARLVSRTVMGNFVTDLEVVTRNLPEGRGAVEMLCVYEVIEGRIQRASFAAGRIQVSAK